MPKLRVPVLHPDVDRQVDYLDREKAEKLVKFGQARWVDRQQRCLRLTEYTEMPFTGGRTHTSRSPFLGAIGRSQRYTTHNEYGNVNGFKFIAPEDRAIFHQATQGETL